MASKRGKQLVCPDGTPLVKLKEEKDFAKSVQIWKGAPKVGKTSTAAALGTIAEKHGLPFRPFFLPFEPGTGGVEIECTSQACPECEGTGKSGRSKCDECHGQGRVRLILNSLEETRKWFEWVAANPELNLAVIDTGDAMYQMVHDAVCQQLDIISPHQANDHGASWAMIYDEMRELLGILVGAGKGVIIIMHVFMEDRRTQGGATIKTAVFNISGKTRTYLAGLANQILHFDVVPDYESEEDGDKHVLVAAAQSGIEAGDHWNLFPDVMDLGDSAEEAAEEILTRFGLLE